MKPRSIALPLLALTIAFATPSWPAPLPDSCGPNQVKFDVKIQKGRVPPAPANDAAQIVLLEDENQMVGPFTYATVRFGIDSQWVGADKGNSYFITEVTPGLHHLCANWLLDLQQWDKNVDLTPFTAEPGKVYYFSAHVTVASREEVLFGLAPLNDDKGKYLVQISKFAISKAR